MIPLALDLLRARRVPMIAVSVALLFVSIGYLALYPSLEEQLTTMAEELPEAYTAVLGDADLASPEGYTRSQVYSLLAPLLVAGVSIAVGSSLARAERDRTAALFVVTPLSRRQVAGSWGLAVVAVATLASLVTIVGVTIGTPLAGASTTLGNIVAATVPLLLLGAFAGAVALVVSTLSGSPGLASGAAWGVIAISFVANSLAELFDAVSWLSEVSPWSWYGSGAAISGDGEVLGTVLLAVVSAVLMLVATDRFARRDLQL